MKKITALALGALAYAAISRISRVHHTRAHARPKAKPAEVQTWEGEGGGLPTGGPGPGVKVAPAAVTDPDLAHGGVGLAG